eukprot:85075-Chlamydomonas_euryale.AAC.1
MEQDVGEEGGRGAGSGGVARETERALVDSFPPSAMQLPCRHTIATLQTLSSCPAGTGLFQKSRPAGATGLPATSLQARTECGRAQQLAASCVVELATSAGCAIDLLPAGGHLMTFDRVTTQPSKTNNTCMRSWLRDRAPLAGCAAAGAVGRAWLRQRQDCAGLHRTKGPAVLQRHFQDDAGCAPASMWQMISTCISGLMIVEIITSMATSHGQLSGLYGSKGLVSGLGIRV